MKYPCYPTLLFLLLLVFSACDNPVEIPPTDAEYEGSGVFTYTDYAPLASQPIRVFYHIPEDPGPNTPILFVFHGGDRNGANYRDAWREQANQRGFMVFVPEFSSTYYPGGDAYNLGNVFEDGDNPSASTLNDEPEWTFSIVEPLFLHIKEAMQNTGRSYKVYGHSAGAQFVHRMLLLKPNNSFGTTVASASGWYTVPDVGIRFPYGTGESPAAQSDLSSFFERDLIVMVGENDSDPNSPGLRRNPTVDLQGNNRLERAQHFFQRSQQIADSLQANFNWRYEALPGVGHDFQPTIRRAAPLLME
ncbi:MAG: hypothetical protein AAGI38_09550 [Bacteroidota bacterium]